MSENKNNQKKKGLREVIADLRKEYNEMLFDLYFETGKTKISHYDIPRSIINRFDYLIKYEFYEILIILERIQNTLQELEMIENRRKEKEAINWQELSESEKEKHKKENWKFYYVREPQLLSEFKLDIRVLYEWVYHIKKIFEEEKQVSKIKVPMKEIIKIASFRSNFIAHLSQQEDFKKSKYFHIGITKDIDDSVGNFEKLRIVFYLRKDEDEKKFFRWKTELFPILKNNQELFGLGPEIILRDDTILINWIENLKITNFNLPQEEIDKLESIKKEVDAFIKTIGGERMSTRTSGEIAEVLLQVLIDYRKAIKNEMEAEETKKKIEDFKMERKKKGLI